MSTWTLRVYYSVSGNPGLPGTHRLHSSSFLGLPYTVLNMNPQNGTTMEPMGTEKFRIGKEGGGLGVCELGFRRPKP